MSFVFDSSEPTRVEATIKLNSGSFVLFLKPPTVEERVADDALSFESFRATGDKHTAAYRSRYMGRLNQVIGWDSVTDSKGLPVEFSPLNLQRLLAKVPAVLDQIGPALAKLYSTDEVLLGESVASRNDSQQVKSVTAPQSPTTSADAGSAVSPSPSGPA